MDTTPFITAPAGVQILPWVQSNVNGVHSSFAGDECWGYEITGVAIVPDGVHLGIQQVKNLVGVIIWGKISYWGTPHSCQIGVVLVNWGSVRLTQAGGVPEFEYFYKAFYTTKFCRGDANVSRVHQCLGGVPLPGQ